MAASLQIDAFSPDDPRTDAFAAVRARIGYSVADEPVADDAGCLVARRDGQPVARLSMCLREDLIGAPGRSGLIGHYEAVDPHAAVELLRGAVDRLRDLGVDRVLGPINGSTWARYRIALPRTADDPAIQPEWFLTEPTNPTTYARHFEDAGFQVAAVYESRIETEPAATIPDEATTRDRLRREGLTIRSLDLERFDDELRALFELSRVAFAENPFYAPVGWPRFRAMYEATRSWLDPALVRLAHDADGRLAGFAFAFRDPLDPDGRVVLKTLAVAPDARGRGLGGGLMADVSHVARATGAPAVIHALMHAENASTRLSERHSTHRFRRYALYTV